MTSRDDIVVLVPHEDGIHALAGIPGVHAVVYDRDAEMPREAESAEVLVTPFYVRGDEAEMVSKLPALQLVQLLIAGVDALGGLPDSIAVSDCSGAHGIATSEWVVASLLAIYRELPGFVRAQDGGNWDQHITDELAGKRVLIVGAGDVGSHVRRRLKPFDVATTMVGRTARDGVYGVGDVLGLLPDHDACVLVAPLTDETRGLVNEKFLAAMPDGAVLVNAARGPIVDTDALVAELVSGRLRAALDVTDPEPLRAGHPLWTAPGLILSPHVAGNVPGAQRRAFAVAAVQIAAYARGDTPPNLVRNGY
ncbi:2-hydroxyacid dehydrogenase [Nocardia sp. NPDC004860]|uniref:2-hydroxyacid dehydrogenase n=1 Tax=Nocardia sp. NPDC004860 TaxID=3154557 RepID=UPI0033AC6C7C